MKKIIVLVLLLLSAPLLAQTLPIPVIGGERVEFTQEAASLTEANGFRYRVYTDNVRPAAGVTTTCSGTTSPFTCQVPMPTLTIGVHTLTVTTSRVIDATTEAESVQSPSISVEMLANAGRPNAPTLPRIIRIP
jgi:hypothetical protein